MEHGERERFRVERLPDVHAFMDRVGDWLVSREAQHNLILGICGVLQSGGFAPAAPPQFAAVTGSDGVVGVAAIRTPPADLLLSVVSDPAAVDPLADALAGDDLPGVMGPIGPTRRFAERWAAATGRRVVVRRMERVMALERVDPQPRASGELRRMTVAERTLIADWVRAFSAEALGESADDAEAFADRWLAGGSRTMYLWWDGDRPVSMCGVGSPTPTGIRVAPVYTPPADRRRGYATSLVELATAEQLAAGRRTVFLFTDLANPTSNAIYERIGYRAVVDVEHLAFEG